MQRRTVTLCRHAPAHAGARGKLWAFSREDLAALLGVSVATVRRREAAGALDPADLESVCRTWADGRWREIASAGLEREINANAPITVVPVEE